MDNAPIHWAIIILLLLSIGINLFWGCSHRPWPFHKAEGVEEHTTNDEELTPKEHELFQDLVKDKLNDSDIVNMVKSNVLTEQLIEKFLNKLSKEGAKETEGDSIETFEIGPQSAGLAAYAAPL